MKHPVERRIGSSLPAERYLRSDASPSQEDRRDELQLHRLSAVLRRQWPTILACLASVIVATVALTRYWPRTYTSSATLLVEIPRIKESSALDVLQRLGQGNTLATEIELIQSGRVLAPVVDRYDLHATVRVGHRTLRAVDVLPEFAAGRTARPEEFQLLPAGPGQWAVRAGEDGQLLARGSSGSRIAVGDVSFRLPTRPLDRKIILQIAPFDAAVAQRQRQVTASSAHREANLIRLECTGSTAEAAQQLCQGVVDSYLKMRTTLQRTEASTTATFLREQTSRLGHQLSAVEDSLERYSQMHGIVALTEQGSSTVRHDADLRAQLDQTEAERTALADMIRGSRTIRDIASFPAFLQDPVITQLLSSLIALENRRSDLRLLRSEQSSEITVLDARVTEIEGQLRARAVSYEDGLAARSRSLTTALAASSRQLSVIPAEQLQLARMERNRSSLAELFQTLTTRQKEAEIAAAVDLPSVSVVDFASRPDRPSSPRLPMNLGLGLVLGLAFGFGVSLVREHGDTRIHDREELEEQTRLPILSIIPSLGKVRLASSSPAADRVPRLQGEDAEVAGEAFRSLGVDLRLIIRGGERDGLRTLAITSAGPGEGKTFTSCNLALMRAADGYRTLLIDADLRANGVGRTLSLDRSRVGLSDYLAGTATLDEALIEVGALSVLPAGRASTHPAGLLESARFGELLAEVRKNFDLVIVDTPPLNVLADAASVSALVDGMVLVVRGGVTERDALALTLQRLERTGGHALGIVLNDVRLPTRYASYSYQNHSGRHQYLQR